MSAEPRGPLPGPASADPGASPGLRAPPPRIYYAHQKLLGGPQGARAHFARARGLGFDTILLSPLFAPGLLGDVFIPARHDRPDPEFAGETSLGTVLKELSELAADEGLRLFMDLSLNRFDAEHPLVLEHPQAFHRPGGGADPIDPRAEDAFAAARPRLSDEAGEAVLHSFTFNLIRDLASYGLSGFRLLGAAEGRPQFWSELIQRARRWAPRLTFVAETQGLARTTVRGLNGCGFDFTTSSLAFWDGRASWFFEEREALEAAAPCLSVVEAPFGPRLAAGAGGAVALRRALGLAPVFGAGVLAPMGVEFGLEEPLDPRRGDPERFAKMCETAHEDFSAEITEANRRVQELADFPGELQRWSGPAAPVTLTVRAREADLRAASEAVLALTNPSLEVGAAPSREALAGLDLAPPAGALEGLTLAPGETQIVSMRRRDVIRLELEVTPREAALETRIVIEKVSPAVSGDFPVKRVVGEDVQVEADVFCDGHEVLGVELQWRRCGEARFRALPMSSLANDRFSARFPLEALGRHEFRIEAWIDRFGGLRSDLEKKIKAKTASEADFQEAEALVGAARKRAKGEVKAALDALLSGLASAPPETRQGLLLASETRDVMSRADERAFRVRTPRPLLVDAERLEARFASWYELFPRSQTDDPARPGTFDTVIARLPAIRDMGFNVLYFPPIHPIGRTNRKGRNNTLTPGPDDPGSPYAIGAAEGGHDTVHPDLGGLPAFRRLIRAAAENGLEIALDFAIQCAPDHPWLKEHPGWFAWRPDGSIRYAENPPKKYEDIVNVDFYAKDAVPGLWVALRDVVEFWIGEGVRTFRVDNPHTKPLPFWRWMIEDVRSRHPEVIFLAEAFTRPKMMYRLAKVGFSQSYTYFTWRNAKWELEEYLEELADGDPKEFFRPHFFVNTPDINPYFLQTSGRSGFLIRTALAATLSGLLGIYSGFELLEAEPIPGKEEYLDSEKFEIKPRDWAAAPNIIPEISALNALRRAHPSLQTHLGIRFERAFNDMILFYSKEADPSDRLLVAVSLDPFASQSAEVELPRSWLEAAGEERLVMEDLLNGARFEWRGARQTLHLGPERPYALWRWVSEAHA